jgi:hypothetical protein
MELQVPKRILTVYPSEHCTKDTSIELARQFAQLTSMSSVAFDCAQDGFEGLQLFERNEYHAIVVAKTIGRSYPKMQGIEFLKIAAACCQENDVPVCPGIVIIGTECESTFLSNLKENERGLVSACICRDVLEVRDFAYIVHDLISGLHFGEQLQSKRTKLTSETDVSAILMDHFLSVLSSFYTR